MIIMSLYSVKPGMKVSTMTPYFHSIFGLYIMYTFHFVKGQEDLNSRSKMAHLSLIHNICLNIKDIYPLL